MNPDMNYFFFLIKKRLQTSLFQANYLQQVKDKTGLKTKEKTFCIQSTYLKFIIMLTKIIHWGERLNHLLLHALS